MAATPDAPGSIFENYNAQGPMGGMFAPAYIQGFAPSEQAVQQWQQANHGLTRADVDALRMPAASTGPSPMSAGQYPYSGPIPLNQTYGDPRGMVDPEALRVLAQGGKYDVAGRRAAIAARVAQNQAAAAPPAAAGGTTTVDPLALKGQPSDHDLLMEMYQKQNAYNPNWG